MQKTKMAIAAILLTVTAMLAVGCTKHDEPDNGGNGGEDPESFIVSISANPSDGGSVTGGGTFNEGDTCTVSAAADMSYFFANWTENDSVVSTEATYAFAVTGNRALVANFTYLPIGAINGKFTVNANGDQVYFSQGNLQYIGSAAAPYWKFADNQWDYFGNTTGQNSSNSNVDRDLFGWGTSGYHDADDAYNVNYQPWSTSIEIVDAEYNPYGYGPSTDTASQSLVGSSANYDWGVYNPISNGGNQTGRWRTLTGDSDGEWPYIFYTRAASTVNGVDNARFAKAKVADVQGMILFPDNYTHPSGVEQPVGINDTWNTGWEGNNYSADDFASMQSAGAVFLPAAGFRARTSVTYPGSYGDYWSASDSGSGNAYYMFFDISTHGTGYWVDRCYGLSVRLVCPAEK